ncbi:Remorin protein [Spatholobus suberectus]|nr:Remorin protein [Spatholobus suberectus]
MLNDQTPSTSHATEENTDGAENEQQIREIHALTPPPRREPNWETHTQSHSDHSSSVSSDNFTSMSREFSALVLAGSSIDPNTTTPSPMSAMHGSEEGSNGNINSNSSSNNNNLGRIGEDELLMMEETNPLAIVADTNPLEAVSSSPPPRRGGSSSALGGSVGEVTVQRVRKEEVEAKIGAWQTAKVAKINNRFKREDAVINGWENEQVQKASSWMKKVERKLEEKRAKALEKMQNEVAKAHRKAEERRASAEAKRGTKVARVLEIANLMRAVGRAPTKRSFF